MSTDFSMIWIHFLKVSLFFMRNILFVTQPIFIISNQFSKTLYSTTYNVWQLPKEWITKFAKEWFRFFMRKRLKFENNWRFLEDWKLCFGKRVSWFRYIELEEIRACTCVYKVVSMIRIMKLSYLMVSSFI